MQGKKSQTMAGKTLTLVVAAPFMMAACNAVPDVPMPRTWVLSERTDTFEYACGQIEGATEDLCACVGNRARRDLTDEQMDLVLANMRLDGMAAARVQSEMPSDDIVAATEFLPETVETCLRD